MGGKGDTHATPVQCTNLIKIPVAANMSLLALQQGDDKQNDLELHDYIDSGSPFGSFSSVYFIAAAAMSIDPRVTF